MSLRLVSAVFFSYASDTYLHSFARFGLEDFDEAAQASVCEYGSPFEQVLILIIWLVTMSDSLLPAGLDCISQRPSPPQGGLWLRTVLEEKPRLIASSQALAELSGEESLAGVPAIHAFFP